MSDRQIAILIDGGFFLKRLPKLVKQSRCETAKNIAGCIRLMCRTHVHALIGTKDKLWHKHIYRIFFYDAVPYEGTGQHPFEKKHIAFGKSKIAESRYALFDELKRQRNVALRLGKVTRDGDWSIIGPASRKIIPTKTWIESLDLSGVGEDGIIQLTETQRVEAVRLQSLWKSIDSSQVRLPLKQKGVDMRIGLDIAALTLKRQANTIILVSGDSDFVPAAKLARREGVQFILDPMWQAINGDLFEHIDGLQSGLPNPSKRKNTSSPDIIGQDEHEADIA